MAPLNKPLQGTKKMSNKPLHRTEIENNYFKTIKQQMAILTLLIHPAPNALAVLTQKLLGQSFHQ